MKIEETYNQLVRPGFVDNIKKIGIDAVFTSAKGDYLYYNDDQQRVFDFISGYGTGILGHNNPRLIEYAQKALQNNTVFQGQRSVRKNAAILADKLNRIMKDSTGEDYVFQFANTGAEANEIALKHAFMEKKWEDKKIINNTEEAALMLESIEDEEKKHQLAAQLEHNRQVLSETKVLVGMMDGFHGKTTGTLKVSYAFGLKYMLDYLNIRTLFIDTYSIADLEEKSKDLERTVYYFQEQKGILEAVCHRYTPAVAYFAEPILGDGGVIELQVEFAKRMRDICSNMNVPLIFDEIQCGMGRTGRFLASEYLGVYADYYCLSKALGGAISKNSVCAISQRRFVKEFGFIHSSTFNEDDYSCGISCEVLNILFENEGRLIKTCQEKGAYIHQELLKVQKKYPELILEVRGKGLMQGFVIDNTLAADFAQLTDVAYINLVEGYLFKHGYRVGTTLTSGAVIRLEPSVYITEEEINTFMKVLSRLGELIKNKDYNVLVTEVTGNE